MIRETDVFRIGTINKPHGVKGEVSFTFTDDIFDRVDGEYLLLMMDGILVPFFLEEYRFKSDNVALVKLEDIDTAEQARRLTNVAVYFPKKYMDAQDEVTSWEYFTGFRVDDLRHGTLGTITAIDDSTLNVLFVIDDGKGGELLLPAHEEFITGLDKHQRIITVNIPDGLIDL